MVQKLLFLDFTRCARQKGVPKFSNQNYRLRASCAFFIPGQVNQEHKKLAKLLIDELITAKATDEREEEINSALDEICPDPEWSNYIFWSNDFQDSTGDLDVDAVIEKIFSYKPIQL